MILVIAKVGSHILESQKTLLFDSLFEKLEKGAINRGDLQIVEIIVCNSDTITGDATEIEILINQDVTNQEFGEKAAFYSSISIGAAKLAGFISSKNDVLKIDERIPNFINRQKRNIS